MFCRCMWKTVIAVFVVATIGSIGFPAHAQSISGVIDGTVRDQKGQPLPGATITINNPATGRTYQASSNETGHYRVPEIPPGAYEVTVDFGGMQSERHTAVRVSVDQVTQEDFSLRVAAQTGVIEVKSTAPTIDTSDPTLRYYFSQNQIENLPLLTRDVDNLGLLAPGVASVRTFSFASTLVPFSVNGSRGRDNNFIIDSVDNNEPLFGGAATQFTNTDIFAEYTIITHQENAEFGRNTGATVNVITKSGSNAFHGSAFWFGQNGIFDALDQADKTGLLTSPPTSFENQGGATLGGPIKKDRSFFFISYQWDGARDDLTQVFPVISTLPDANSLSALRALAPTNPAAAALMSLPSVSNVPTISAPCFSGTAPAGFNAANPCLPAQAKLIPGTPGCTAGATNCGVAFNVFRDPHANVFDVRDQEVSGRYDQKISSQNDLYVRYLFDNLSTPNIPLSSTGDTAFSDLGLLPEGRILTRQRTQSVVVDHRFYGVNYLNELRFSYSRIAQGIGAFGEPASVLNEPAATVEDTFAVVNGIPGFGTYSNNFPSAGNRFTIGQNSSPSEFDSNIYQLQENFSYIHGRNNYKFGGDFVRTNSNLSSTPGNLGQYVFGTVGITGGFNTFLNSSTLGPTAPDLTFQRLVNLRLDSSGHVIGQGQNSLPLWTFDQAYFLQDDFQLRPNLTLNAGVRLEVFGQPINQLRKVVPSAQNIVPTVLPGEDVGPRLGLAWSPSQNLVVRAGYGIQYNPTISDIALSIWQSGPISPFIVTVSPTGAAVAGGLLGSNISAATVQPLPTVVQSNGIFPNAPFSLNSPATLANLNQGVASCGSFVAGGRPALGVTVPGSVPVVNCSNQFTVDPGLTNPYVQNYSLGMQWQIAPSWMLEAGFVGSKGTELFLRQDENPIDPIGQDGSGWATSAQCPTLTTTNIGCLEPRVNPAHGDITAVTNSGDSTYNALEVTATKRYDRTRAGDLSFTVAYTWSHMIDNASEIFGPTVQFLPSGGSANGDFLTSYFLSAQAQGLQSIEAITPFSQSAYNLAAEKGNSSFDRRHRVAASYLWEPFPTRGKLLGGWQLNGIVTYQSGQPFSPLNGGPSGACADANGDGILTNDRPAIGNPNAPLNSVALLKDPNCSNLADGYVDLAGNTINPATAHFVQVPLGYGVGQSIVTTQGTFVAGSAGRDILVGPSLIEWDGALFKNFQIRESKTLQFRWEVYDVLNHANPGFAIGNVFASDAQPTSAYAFSPRSTPASVTGVIPENSIDAKNLAGTDSFLSRTFMNTSSRTMQFGVKFIF